MTGVPGDETGALREAYVGDTFDVSPFSWMFGTAGNGLSLASNVPYYPGNLGVGPVDSTVVMPYAAHAEEDRNITAIAATTAVMSVQPHHPVDTRSRAERRASKRGYKKAKSHYGKTYIIPKKHMILAMLVALGLILFLSAAMFQVYVHWAQSLGFK